MTRDYEMTCAKYEAEIADLKAKLAEAEHALLLASAENDKLREQLQGCVRLSVDQSLPSTSSYCSDVIRYGNDMWMAGFRKVEPL